MSTHVKAAVAMAIGSVVAMVLWGVSRKILVVQGILRDEEAGPVAKLALFALFFVFSLSLLSLALHGFVAAQGRIGNGEVGFVRFLRDHEFGVTLAMWGFVTAGMLIALPVMWTDFFGFPTYVGNSHGVLAADVGMSLAEVGSRSSLKIVPGSREGLTGSSRSAGEVVFDFEVGGTQLRLERCRYYWLETGSHNDPKIVHINVGLSPRKLSRTASNAEREALVRRVRVAGWAAGHFEFTDPALITLHGGTREGDGIYWAHGDTLLILREKRVDDSQRDEDPSTAGEFIQYAELVPRHSSNYSKLIYETPPAEQASARK